MKLTKNEKKVLKLLLENGKVSDSSIAAKLKISSQAVGKIRRKLEKNVISSYTVKLDYSKLGIRIFAISLSKVTQKGLDKGELWIGEVLRKIDNVIQVYRLPNSNYTHIILYGFKDIGELDEFFHSDKNRQAVHKYIENKELFTFSNGSLMKDDPSSLFCKMIDEIGSPSKKNEIKEIESFKRRLEG